MNFELYIENLGAIEKAEITISPLTILAGENGTGKSFVTKFLYSVLNVLMRDVYKDYLIYNTENILFSFKSIINIDNGAFNELQLFFEDFRRELNNSNFSYNKFFNKEFINEFNIILEKYSEENYNIMKKLQDDFLNNKEVGVDKSNKSNDFINLFIFNGLLEDFVSIFSNPEQYQEKSFSIYLIDEIKSNFQIPIIKNLIRYGCDKLIFEIKNVIRIEILNNENGILKVKFFGENIVFYFDRLVFFESSIYWRLSKDILNNMDRLKTLYLSSKINDERLTGIPKHFLDLRDLVFANFKNGERPAFIEQCANDLQKHLNGKFHTDSYDLSFETNQGKTISKNLVSFGMTNLGIIQAILNKNIINKGSFVFIDEPESNLHPEWQAVLADVLVKLAQNGVFVVITTHSSDMLKALEVKTDNKESNFISANYFEQHGRLTQFDEQDIDDFGKLPLICKKLLEPYAMMTFAKQGGFFDD